MMSRLTIDITVQQHQALKAMAALEGKSIKNFAIERLFPVDEQIAVQELRVLLQNRLANAQQSGALERCATEIAEEALRELDVQRRDLLPMRLRRRTNLQKLFVIQLGSGVRPKRGNTPRSSMLRPTI
jgi:uncharacterized protein (DUF1778 family)